MIKFGRLVRYVEMRKQGLCVRKCNVLRGGFSYSVRSRICYWGIVEINFVVHYYPSSLAGREFKHTENHCYIKVVEFE